MKRTHLIAAASMIAGAAAQAVMMADAEQKPAAATEGDIVVKASTPRPRVQAAPRYRRELPPEHRGRVPRTADDFQDVLGKGRLRAQKDHRRLKAHMKTLEGAAAKGDARAEAELTQLRAQFEAPGGDQETS